MLSPGYLRISKLKHLLGKINDKDIAIRANTSIYLVYKFRKKFGYPSCKKNENRGGHVKRVIKDPCNICGEIAVDFFRGNYLCRDCLVNDNSEDTNTKTIAEISEANNHNRWTF